MLNCCYSWGLGELYCQLDLMFDFTNINFTGKTNAELDRSQNLLKTGKLDFFQIKDQKSLKTSIENLWVSLTSVPAIAWKRERKGFLVYDLGYDPNLGATSYYTILQHNWLRLFLKEHYYLNCTHEFPSKTFLQLIFSLYVKWVKKKRFKKIAFIQSHHPQSSPWVKIQIIGGKFCLSLKGKTLLFNHLIEHGFSSCGVQGSGNSNLSRLQRSSDTYMPLLSSVL